MQQRQRQQFFAYLTYRNAEMKSRSAQEDAQLKQLTVNYICYTHTHIHRYIHIHTNTVEFTLTLRKVHVAAAVGRHSAGSCSCLSWLRELHYGVNFNVYVCDVCASLCVWVYGWVCTCLTYNVIKKGWEWYLCSWSVSQPALMGIANGQKKEKGNKTADKYRQIHTQTYKHIQCT